MALINKGKFYFKGAVYYGITIMCDRLTHPDMSVCQPASRIEKNGKRHDIQGSVVSSRMSLV